MSGSPVYIGGKLIGAVSYTWAFTKDPVAGITPIGEMLTSLNSMPEEKPEPLEPSDARYGALDLPPGTASPVPGEARPIVTPLALSGFTPEALRYLEPWLPSTDSSRHPAVARAVRAPAIRSCRD